MGEIISPPPPPEGHYWAGVNISFKRDMKTISAIAKAWINELHKLHWFNQFCSNDFLRSWRKETTKSNIKVMLHDLMSAAKATAVIPIIMEGMESDDSSLVK